MDMDDACGVCPVPSREHSRLSRFGQIPRLIESQANVHPCWVSPSGQHPVDVISRVIQRRALLDENGAMFRRR